VFGIILFGELWFVLKYDIAALNGGEVWSDAPLLVQMLGSWFCEAGAGWARDSVHRLEFFLGFYRAWFGFEIDVLDALLDVLCCEDTWVLSQFVLLDALGVVDSVPWPKRRSR
jgi:hypothetical protein